eukprot:COSAG01_NODE_11611_length_1894_cov_31.483565_2_plen_214_part_00
MWHACLRRKVREQLPATTVQPGAARRQHFCRVHDFLLPLARDTALNRAARDCALGAAHRCLAAAYQRLALAAILHQPPLSRRPRGNRLHCPVGVAARIDAVRLPRSGAEQRHICVCHPGCEQPQEGVEAAVGTVALRPHWVTCAAGWVECMTAAVVELVQAGHASAEVGARFVAQGGWAWRAGGAPPPRKRRRGRHRIAVQEEEIITTMRCVD